MGLGAKRLAVLLGKTAGKAVLREVGVMGPATGKVGVTEDLLAQLDIFIDKLIAKLEGMLIRVLGQLIMDPDVAIRFKDIVATGTAEGVIAATDDSEEDPSGLDPVTPALDGTEI